MPNGWVIAIGNFDGVHVGHQAILRRACAEARRRGVRAMAMTFEPHPVSVLRPGEAPPRITGADEKLALLREVGVDHVEVLEPRRDLLGLSAGAFVEWLVEKHGMEAIVEGADFRFGAGRSGDVGTLRELGAKMGFETVVVEPVTVVTDNLMQTPVGSSLVRRLVLAGRVRDAAILLGRTFSLAATVVEGEKRGRQLGFATVNLDAETLHGRLIPGHGVYAGSALLANGWTLPAAISVGAKPTFGRHTTVVEGHLVGYEGDLYGQRVELRFERWLRDQSRFPNVELLRRQLERDVAETRRLAGLGVIARQPTEVTA
ncbi:MAG: riboflavin biosynthesis protein RibF [Verrucomicrobiae bacterium]|nr:riboflavin biosynthesis protein RibF [Verrucomicrobiae bacterium]